MYNGIFMQGFFLSKKKLLAFEPQVYLLTLTVCSLFQICSWGGMQRMNLLELGVLFFPYCDM